jgi:hypothetical protein
MTNSVATNDLKKNLLQFASNSDVNMLIYAKFDGKKGMFVHGKDNQTILDLKIKPIVNLASLRHGAVCLVGDKAVDETEESVWTHPTLIRKDSIDALPDHGPYKKTANGEEGWRPYVSMQIYDPAGEAEYIVQLGSGGARRGFSDLMAQVIKAAIVKKDIVEYVDGVPQWRMYPVVTLNITTKKTPAGHNVARPVFTIDSWIKAEDTTFSNWRGKPKRDTEAPKVEGDAVVVD